MRIVSESEFSAAIRLRLRGVKARAVVGPGRSGAVASVYASHILGVPFIPYGTACPDHLRPLLIVDTARKSGATLRKAERRYGGECVVVHVFDEPPRLRFWYEPEAHDAEIKGGEAVQVESTVRHWRNDEPDAKQDARKFAGGAEMPCVWRKRRRHAMCLPWRA